VQDIGFTVELNILTAPVGSVNIFLTAVESRTYTMWCSEITNSGGI